MMNQENSPQENIIVYSYSDAINKSSLDTISKMIMHVINTHSDNTSKSSFLSVSTIAKEASCSERSVYNKLPILEDSEFLTVERRFRNKEKISSVYYLELPQRFSLGFRKRKIIIGGGTESDSVPPESDSVPPESPADITKNLTYKSNYTAVKKTSNTILPHSDSEPKQQKTNDIFNVEAIPENYMVEAKKILGLGKEDASKDEAISDVFSMFQGHLDPKRSRNPLGAWKTWVRNERSLQQQPKKNSPKPSNSKPKKTDEELQADLEKLTADKEQLEKKKQFLEQKEEALKRVREIVQTSPGFVRNCMGQFESRLYNPDAYPYDGTPEWEEKFTAFVMEARKSIK